MVKNGADANTYGAGQNGHTDEALDKGLAMRVNYVDAIRSETSNGVTGNSRHAIRRQEDAYGLADSMGIGIKT